MSENPPEPTPQVTNTSNADTNDTVRGEQASADSGSRRPTRPNNQFGNVTGSTPRDFEGDTPKLGGILGLRSENVTKKNQLRFIMRKIGYLHYDRVQER